jgi:predicted ATP-grasp superfamily ATP-dependent carboligase
MNKTKVVILAKRRSFLTCKIISSYLKSNYNILSRVVLFNNETLNFDLKADEIIMPISINTTNACYKANVKNCIVNPAELTEFLNNKQSCGEYIDNIGIKSIPTFYNKKTDTIFDLKKFCSTHDNINIFIIKPVDRYGALGIYTLTKSELLDKYSNNRHIFDEYIIQIYLERKKLYAIDCLVENGEIIGHILNKGELFYDKKNIIPFQSRFTNYKRKILKEDTDYYNNIIESTKKIVKSVNYNGFIEIEYLGDNNNIYFLEINPRLSGNITYSNGIKMPVIDEILIPYIISVNRKNNRLNKNIKLNKPESQNLPDYVIHLSFRIFLLFLVLITILIIVYNLLKSKV